MARRAYIIGIMALGLTATAFHATPVLGRFVSSAQNFHRHFQDLRDAQSSLSPIERFVFSLVLADTKAAGPARS